MHYIHPLIMKRYALLLALVLLMGGTAWAQDTVRTSTPDTNSAPDTEENVIGGRPQRSNTQRESNVLGAPVYYNIDGSLRTADNTHGNPRAEYVRPRHHWRNTLDSQFNTYFCEVEGMLGMGDVALGFNFTCLPERWGVYGSLLAGMNHNYATLGPVLRLSDYDDACDWHLYGGIMVGDGIGGEVGLRIAADKRTGSFGWFSGSMGMAIIDGESYVTMGLSLELTAIVGLSLLFF